MIALSHSMQVQGFPRSWYLKAGRRHESTSHTPSHLQAPWLRLAHSFRGFGERLMHTWPGPRGTVHSHAGRGDTLPCSRCSPGTRGRPAIGQARVRDFARFGGSAYGSGNAMRDSAQSRTLCRVQFKECEAGIRTVVQGIIPCE